MAASGGGGLPASRGDPGSSVRQPLEAHSGGVLRELPSRAGATFGSEGRVLLHAGARLVVAEHGGDKALGFGQPVPRTKVVGHRDSKPRGSSVGGRAERGGRERELALHYRGSAHQTS